jgi:hypothetical protein
VLKDRRIQIAWRAWLVDKGTMQMLERPSKAVIAERARKYFRWRLEEALAGLCASSEPLAEVLAEILLLAAGEEEIINWRPPAIEEMLQRIGEPLACAP